jgi:hypothetical protein
MVWSERNVAILGQKEMFNIKIIFQCDDIYMQTPVFITAYKKNANNLYSLTCFTIARIKLNVQFLSEVF